MNLLLKDYIAYREKILTERIKIDKAIKTDTYHNVGLLKELLAIKEMLQ